MNLPDFKITFRHRFSGEVSFVQKLEDAAEHLQPPWKQIWLFTVKCFAVWLQDYKIKAVIKDIDEQAVVIKDKWSKQEVENVRVGIESRVKITDPDAVVTVLPPSSPVPGFLIEYSPDGSYAQSILGGAMEITSGSQAPQP
jgi:hypothetical protein